jgi:hypothetical protein
VPHGRSELSQPALYPSVQQGEEENLDLTFNTLINHTCPTPEQRQDQEQEQSEEEEDAKRILIKREKPTQDVEKPGPYLWYKSVPQRASNVRVTSKHMIV